MKTIECAREADVLDAIATGRWDPALRAHVEECAICADVAAVADLLREDGAAAWREAQVPSSARVWWRAEMRARQEAARRAAQPITLVHGVAGACVIGLLLAIVELLWPRVAESLAAGGGLSAFLLAPPVLIPLGVVLGACVLLAPLALYLAFSDK